MAGKTMKAAHITYNLWSFGPIASRWMILLALQ